MPVGEVASIAPFAAQARELLARHVVTARHAETLAQLDEEESAEARDFTIALFGRMKSGKSTLLNALLGQRLAPVGVNEMTATINRFDYGPAEHVQEFEVHWKDPARPAIRLPLARMEEFSGASEQILAVDHIRFVSPSPFLDGVRLIDTPGTMSTLDAHEETTAQFLENARGLRADATVLVLPPLALEADQEALVQFASASRAAGQGPYNTLAVIQKWESFTDPEPHKRAEELAHNVRARLRQHVADVFPVSGLLAQFAQSAPDEVMERLTFLGTRTSEADLVALMARETRFGRERDGIALSGAERAQLLESARRALLGWEEHRAAGTFEMIRFAALHAQRCGVSSGERLRAAMHEISQIDRLREALDRRFCAVSDLVQAGGVLKQTIEPCRSAMVDLRDELERHRIVCTSSQAALDEGPEGPVHAALSAALPLVRNQWRSLEDTVRELGDAVRAADARFDLLVEDIANLNRIGEIGGGEGALGPEEELSIRHLLGQYGSSLAQRLHLAAEADESRTLEAAKALYNRLFARRASSPVIRHALKRLEHMLADLERASPGARPAHEANE